MLLFICHPCNCQCSSVPWTLLLYLIMSNYLEFIPQAWRTQAWRTQTSHPSSSTINTHKNPDAKKNSYPRVKECLNKISHQIIMWRIITGSLRNSNEKSPKINICPPFYCQIRGQKCIQFLTMATWLPSISCLEELIMEIAMATWLRV